MIKNAIFTVIAIDGPAASGKGTLSKKIAAAIDFAHMDTGLLYRAVGWEVLNRGGDPADHESAIEAALEVTRRHGAGYAEDTLKTENVTAAASVVAANPEVRNILLNLQKTFAAHPPEPYKGAVLDGRDIGTVICPDAPVKLYITAALETRAERRFKELQSKGNPVTYDAVLRDMRDRDSRDSGRASAPMKPAIDAVILDTTDLNQDQAFEKALAVVREKTRINSNS